MSNYMIPADDEYVEAVAMAIAHGRLYKDASATLESMSGISIEGNEVMARSFDLIFERLWQGTTDVDVAQKDSYRADARAAIAAINLKLLTKG